ncbi:Lysine exporter protein (LYSE/YGGA) [Modestobacter italicus]|uniref:Lysine exporter protein (LYSE/YGGA) n=1 Tax=Modestobacter italicus (strain DSM 44449 / CECT 9708 / BC 501) TaxID=2732864 RepID=I4EX18_MODI5|nr:LysE family translocator [Modestobacter marinus]CCH87931.1 Lysine exporter protein (LYSE/YGGA) [Modestobacter marinus]
MDQLWAFAALALVLSVTPGPDDALVLSSCLRGGPRLAAATALGVAAGSLLWGAAAAVGLAAVVSRSPGVYGCLRIAGAAYLVVLGGAILRAQASGRRPSGDRGEVPHRRSGGAGAAFAAGLASDVLNPKIGVFYLAVLPQFIPAGEPVLGYTMLLCSVDVAVAMVWFAALTGLAQAAVGWCRRPAVVLWSQRLMGAALIGVGTSVALPL